MGRFSRVKGGCGKKSEAPDLEAHFSDGAWYDIVLRAADPTRNRFLVQVCSPFPTHGMWAATNKSSHTTALQGLRASHLACA